MSKLLLTEQFFVLSFFYIFEIIGNPLEHFQGSYRHNLGNYT